MATELGSLAGQRIAIGTDGGRLRSRVPRSRGRKANKRRGFDAPWREPKVLTIYEIDNEGRQRLLDADEAFALL